MNVRKILVRMGLVIALVVVFLGGYSTGRYIKTQEIRVDKNPKTLSAEAKIPEVKKIAIKDYGTAQTTKDRVNPKIKITVTKKPDGNFLLTIFEDAFYFTPREVGKAVRQNTGQARVFVNDNEVGFTTKNENVLDKNLFATGTNTVKVYLVANNNATWLQKDGKEVVTTKEVQN